MKKIVLDMQSGLYADAIRRVLVQELSDCQVIISGTPESTAARCRILRPDALLLEVTPLEPWALVSRLKLTKTIKAESPSCKIIALINDKADSHLADSVKKSQKRRKNRFLHLWLGHRKISGRADRQPMIDSSVQGRAQSFSVVTISLLSIAAVSSSFLFANPHFSTI